MTPEKLKQVKAAIADALQEAGPKPLGFWSGMARALGVQKSDVNTIKYRMLHPKPIKPRCRHATEKSAEVNARILEVLSLRKRQAEAEELSDAPTWAELAKELGMTPDAVEKRASRLRKGRGALLKPAPVCECDEYGPCALPGHREQYERALGYAG